MVQAAELIQFMNARFDMREPGAPGNPDQNPPALAKSLDYELVDTINAFDLATHTSALSPLRTEELLESCLARLEACMILREKAHDVQTRAILTAIETTYGRDAITSQHELDIITQDVSDASVETVDALRNALIDSQTKPLDLKKALSEEKGQSFHYGERYKFLKELFDINLKEALARARQAATGLESIYGMSEVAVPAPTQVGYLNTLAQWAQSVSNRLDLELDRRRWRKMTIALNMGATVTTNEVYTAPNFINKRSAQAFDFTLSEDYFETRGFKKPLLRSFSIQVVTDEAMGAPTRLWHCKVEPPASDLVAGDLTFPCTAASGDPTVAESFAVTGDVHNLRPYGAWDLKMPSTDITGSLPIANVANVLLHLTLSTRAN